MTSIKHGLLICLLTLTGSAGAQAMAPKPPVHYPETRAFVQGAQTAQPMDFTRLQLKLVLDVARGKASGHAVVDFEATGDGLPYFLLDGMIQGAALDGSAVELVRSKPPLATSTFTVATRAIARATSHQLIVDYEMPAENVTFRDGGVGFLTAMGDVQDGAFFEQYGPSSFEDDPHRISMEIQLIGASRAHRIFSDARVTELGAEHWSLEFPEWYTSNLLYVHVTDQPLTVIQGSARGLERTIPFTVYSSDAKAAKKAAGQLPGLFAELEGDYGPYLHDSFVVYISGKGGMEHAGATVTAVNAMDHELLHQWFGRGVLPQDGRSGWIDEAAAAYRDGLYWPNPWPAKRAVANLANFPAFERFTAPNCYHDGRQMFGELDALLGSQRRFRQVLKAFFAEYKTRSVSTADFQHFVERTMKINLENYFRRYVYGDETVTQEEAAELDPRARGSFSSASSAFGGGTKHPPKLTRAEILKLR
jgi:aminopeptidase N